MRNKRLNQLNKDQRGFTLIELIIAIAITGLIIVGLSSAVYQLVASNAENRNHTTAVRQVQAVGHWMSQDIQMANEVLWYYPVDPDPVDLKDDPNTNEGGIDVLVICWSQFTLWVPADEVEDDSIKSITHKVTYNLKDEKLTRYHYTFSDPDGEGQAHTGVYPDIDVEYDYLVDDDSLQVAQYIELGSFWLTNTDSQYTLNVEAIVGGFQPVSEIRKFDIDLRPNAS